MKNASILKLWVLSVLMFTFISTASILPAAETVELCTAIDGSGSIGSSDFQLQIEGLARAIKNPYVVSQNSRVTLSIVQFSSGVRVEVAPILIDSQATADAVAVQVRAIKQIGAGTLISIAIDACTQQFRFTTDKQVIDVSTDGQSSDSPSEASNRAIVAGVDVINALGVGNGINVNQLQSIVRPQPASNFPEKGFVYITPSFDDYAKAIKSKIAAETGQLLAIECTQIPQVECNGLLELYSNTRGYDWKESWNADQKPCEWKGVTCQEGHVTQIDLSANQLNGTIPPSIGYYFRDLSNLNLADNQLTGLIPSSLGHFSQLRYLALNNNQLNGSVPGTLGYIEQLETLKLNDNQLTGFIPKSFGKLQQLQRFDISNNQLIGQFPKLVEHLPQLKLLNLSHNQLTGSLPDFLNHWSQPVYLDLSGNQMIIGSAICPNVADLPQSECHALVHLYNSTDGKNWKNHAGWNRIDGEPEIDGEQEEAESEEDISWEFPYFENIGQQLKHYFGSTPDTPKAAKIPKAPCDWYGITCENGQITQIQLEDNQLKGSLPESIGNLGKLRSLDLSGNNLTGPIPESLFKLDQLEDLYVSNNQFSCDEIPASSFGDRKVEIHCD